MQKLDKRLLIPIVYEAAERHEEILQNLFDEWLSNEVNYLLYNQAEIAIAS